MANIGNPFTPVEKKVVLCGSGELGKEIAIELERYGVHVVAVDKYANAPAMQVAQSSHVLSMLDGDALAKMIEEENPDLVIPEVEAIATQKLIELEKKGYTVIPTAKATYLTMNREGIRRLAAEELGIPTSRYEFAQTEDEFRAAVGRIGFPCVVKPVMSSSGHGQSVVRNESQVAEAWRISQEGGRAGGGKVIVEGFVDFDYEITLLTVRHCAGTTFLKPVGHHQVDGDYRESWQPQGMSAAAEKKAQEIAGKITDALGGYGIFGVELFVKGEDVIFSEVSPRPHDTGMVTMISQDMSEFALHARAFWVFLFRKYVSTDRPLRRQLSSRATQLNMSFRMLTRFLKSPECKSDSSGNRRSEGTAASESSSPRTRRLRRHSRKLKGHIQNSR